MVISPKNMDFLPFLCPLCGLFNYIWSILMISYEPIGRGESYYAKNMIKNLCIHWAIKFKLSKIFGWQFFKSHIS